MRAKLVAAAAICALLIVTVSVFCQQSPPALVTINRLQIRADRIAEFQELAKQRAEGLKKAGPSDLFSLVCRVAVGNMAEFWMFTPMNRFADRDGQNPFNKFSTPEERATWNARFSQYLERYQTVIVRPISDLTVNKAGTNRLPAYIRLRILHARPWTVNDFISIAKADIIPAVKKANGGIRISKVLFGGSVNDFFISTPFDKWAELDDNTTFRTALGGDAGMKRLQEKMSPIEANTEEYVLRVLPDLSYIPASPSASSR